MAKGWFLYRNSHRTLASASIILCGLLVATAQPEIDSAPASPVLPHFPAALGCHGGQRGCQEEFPFTTSPSWRDPGGSFPGEGQELSWKAWQGLYISQGCGQEGSELWAAGAESELPVLTEPQVGHEDLLDPARPAAGSCLGWEACKWGVL